MKLLIELPTWLGDAIMATPAIENLLNHYPKANVTILGSFVATLVFKNHPRVDNIVVDETKKKRNRYVALYKLSKEIGKFDMSISFRSSFSTKLFLFFVGSPKRFRYKKIKKHMHQVLKYNEFINKVLKQKNEVGDLKLYYKPFEYKKPTLGINPGATYGSAKRWYPQEFAKVAINLASKYDIVIFGGSGEVDIARDIEELLKNSGISNYQNLAGKTTVSELIEKIAGLDIFITNDSGPMHIAAAFKVQTYSIFGPTRYKETNQWNNPNEHIITKNLDCAPCMKRVCPLGHHDCMKLIKAEDVLKVINE
ncbi:glycosyltransferase family 9 protein [Arcobacter sp. KX21116]|uniref:glycosyltransferase family 9 protein n=1 Tax=Arcobacter iocasae TaxID=2906515 RepID=UPI0035D44028